MKYKVLMNTKQYLKDKSDKYKEQRILDIERYLKNIDFSKGIKGFQKIIEIGNLLQEYKYLTGKDYNKIKQENSII